MKVGPSPRLHRAQGVVHRRAERRDRARLSRAAARAVRSTRASENTTITVTYYHAPTQTSGTPDYSVLETFQLTRPRRDRFFGVGNREKAAAGSGSR
jgi:hypothetical protein